MGPFDYIVVGAGSAGCVVAARLSEDPRVKVLLIEAGPEPNDPWIKIPAGMARLFAPGAHNWGYMTEPEPGLDGRRLYWPRGKGLGGSSAINGMLYVRGHPLDFDHWRQLGNPGWGWDDVLPLFKRSERNDRGGDDMHGGSGELAVSDPVMRHSFSKLFIEAAKAAGFAETDDFNAGVQDGVGFLQFTIRNGERHSAYEAFVKPVRGRANLTVLTGAPVQRVMLEGKQAIGVVVRRDGVDETITCEGEVVLAGGVINSPQLLMLSGIGPGAHLAEVGVTTAHDLPGVGKNLHDHMYCSLTYAAPRRHSVNHLIRGPRAWLEGARYAVLKSGVLTNGTSQTTLFARVAEGVAQPDIQINTRPLSFTPVPGGGIEVAPNPTVTVAVCQVRPQSRGQLTLKSADPAEAPRIEAGYLQSPVDQQVMAGGVRLAMRIMDHPSMAEFRCIYDVPTDEAGLIAYLRKTTGPVYHPVGTCRMGPDETAVVDPRLRVHGIAGLRVADASIMPSITSGNTNAPAIMIGEKAADLLREDRR